MVLVLYCEVSYAIVSILHPLHFWDILRFFVWLFLIFLRSWGEECLFELFIVCITSIRDASVRVYTLGWFGIKGSFHFRDLKPFLIFSGSNGLIALSGESGSQWQHCVSKAAHSSLKTIAADLWMESVWIFDAVRHEFWPDAECGCPPLPCSGKHKQ